MMIYRVLAGENVDDTISNVMTLSKKYNRKVRFNHNGCQVTVNKRLSFKHIYETWQKIMDARFDRTWTVT